MNIPTQLTLLRLISIPVLVCCYYLLDMPLLNLSVFLCASFTDWLDGYTARRNAQVTELGAFLDPVADKLLVVTALIMTINHYHTLSISLPAIFIICREIAVSSLREWMAKYKHDRLGSSNIAKSKTAFQFLALSVFMYQPSIIDQYILWVMGVVFLQAAAALSFISFILYIKNTWSLLTFSLKNE